MITDDLATARIEPFVERRRGRPQDGWFAAMFEHAPVGVAIASTDGHLELVNGAFTRLLGYAPDEAIGRSVEDLTHPDDRAASRERNLEVGSGRRESWKCEKRYLHKNGRTIWAITTVSGVELNGRRHLVGQIVDLSETKRATAAAQDALGRLSALMNNLPGVVYRCRNDANWSMDFMSEGSLDLTGYAPEDFAPGGRVSYLDLIVEEDLEAVSREAREALAARRSFSVRHRIRTAQGQIKWVVNKGAGVYAPDGTALAVEGLACDITTQVEAQTTERRLADIVANSQDAIVSASLDLRFTSWNAGAEAMFGYSTAEAVHMRVHNLVAPERLAFIAQQLATLQAGSVLRNIECIATRKDGTAVEVELTVSPMLDERGAVAWLSAIVRDITSRKRLERSMDATVRALAGTVEMRDPYTSGHQDRVAEIAVGIGRAMGLPEERLRGLHLAATIHDIGKLCVPAEILSKPGRLSPIEFELIKTHPAAGAKILEGIEFPWPIREMVWQHHERADGTGYPRGLKGDEILLESRILAVADALEAIAAHRPYRPALGIEAGLRAIVEGRGTKFDERVVDACLKFHRGRKEQEHAKAA